MRIVDEKGRLFGKINVIDFLVIVFLLALTPVFYYGYKIFLKKPDVAKQETIQPPLPTKPKRDIMDRELVFDLIKLTPETASLISVGDKEIDASGQVIGEIVKLEKFGPYAYTINIGKERRLSLDDPLLKHVVATIKMKVGIEKNNIYYKDAQITSENSVDFVTDRYRVAALYLPPKENVASEHSIDKVDLNNKENIDALKEIVRITKTKMSSLEYKLDTLDKKVDYLHTRVDGFQYKLDDLRLSHKNIRN